MKNQTKRLTALTALTCVFAVSVAGATVTYAEEDAYFVCFSNQNYAVRNSNKLKETEDGAYILENVTLSSANDFYVTDNAGLRWYASDNEPLSVEDAGSYVYDIMFSPSADFGGEDGWVDTGCKITYRFHIPESYSVLINGESAELTYNPYHTAYDLYYISEINLTAGDKVSADEEEHEISASGYYRILFTPGEEINGSAYAFDENGNYGSGSNYVYRIYIEDAPRYFAVFEEGGITAETDTQINGKDAYLMERYEKSVSSAEYRTAEFFVGERDYDVRYFVYEQTLSGAFKLIDDDNDEDTDRSKLRATDAGWYTLSLTDNGSSYLSVLREEDKNFGGWYMAGEFNGYGFNADGGVDVDEKFRFAEVEEGDDDYEEDYKQYILYFTVTEKQLKSGNIEFYITDGKTKYKSLNGYITLNRAGKYKILFSEEHLYGRLHYRYVLENEDKEYTRIDISTAEEFNAFAKNCSRSADYSVNLIVYLTKDIDFKGVEFVPADSFSGKFLGQNHVLKNITYKDGAEYNSVFSVVTRGGSIERLELENVNLGGKDCDFAGVIGRNYGTVDGLRVSGKVYGNNYVGGITAFNGVSVIDGDSATVDSNDVLSKAVIKNCVSNVTVNGVTYAGGIAGYNSGEILSSKTSGQVSGYKNKSSSAVINTGGIAGYSSGKISNCVNEAEVSGGDDSLYAGGIAGLCTGEIYFSFNRADVSASRYAGGVCGYYGTVENNSEDLNSFFGGMDYGSFLDNYFNNGSQDNGNAEVVAGILNYCANYGKITSLSYAGGILGNSTATGLKIYNCASTGDIAVTAGSYAGGIAGLCTGAEIKGCLSSGLVSAKGLGGGNYAGGIAGYGGSVYYCMSASTLKGNDYVGGIAGYATSDIIGCYTNVLITASADSVNTGAIAGFAEKFNLSLNSFGESVKGNYYVGASDGIFGIHGKDYAGGYNFAATAVSSNVLATEGMISPELCGDFSREYWQGGKGSISYPVLCYFEKVLECEEFGDDEEWERLFAENAQNFINLSEDSAKLTYTVTFMEWNKDNGDLYDDGALQTDNFEIISAVRVFAGGTVEIPALNYAQSCGGGRFIYDGGDARYFVNFPEVGAVNSNIIVYAEYKEVVNSVSSENNTVFAEGDFYAGTCVELVRTGDYISLKFTLDGSEIYPENITVKIFAGENAEEYTVYVADYRKEVKAQSEVSGRYVKFGYTSGQYFRLEENEKNGMPFWAWLLIGIGGTLAVCGAVFVTLYLIKRKKPAVKEQQESTEKIENAEITESVESAENTESADEVKDCGQQSGENTKE